ncbi:uncharacterized protein METZ01_LOCUS267891 [marine metagenome]|uniref:Site-specific DNA-methyltransferase (adenine-specific) n=1 Tax=marine metagenome TaxID=408172 RepID=A0A382JVQ4_9ZZZZ
MKESLWKTATDLLELIDSGDGREIQTLHNRLSSELMQDYITNYPTLLSNVVL